MLRTFRLRRSFSAKQQLVREPFCCVICLNKSSPMIAHREVKCISSIKKLVVMPTCCSSCSVYDECRADMVYFTWNNCVVRYCIRCACGDTSCACSVLPSLFQKGTAFLATLLAFHTPSYPFIHMSFLWYHTLHTHNGVKSDCEACTVS